MFLPPKRCSLPLALAASLLFIGGAQAQYVPFPIGRGGPHGAINFGVGIMQQMHRQQQAADARRHRAYLVREEQHRRAALSRTKAGRAQLARERNAQRKQAQQQDQLIRALATGLFGGGGGGRNYDYGSRSDPGQRFHEDQLLRRQHGLD